MNTTMTQTASTTPALPFSMSSTLAHGLVHRMVDEYGQLQADTFLNRNNHFGGRKITTLPSKRNALFKAQTTTLLGLIPPAMRAAVHTIGKQDGSQKHAKLSVIHWHTNLDTNRMTLMITFFEMGWPKPKRFQLFEVSTHALSRLFYRLKTTRPEKVLVELQTAALCFCQWLPFFKELLLSVNQDISIGLPTENGILYLKNIGDTTTDNPLDLLGATWVSNARMQDREEKMQHVERARKEGGFVLQVGHVLHAVTKAHLQAGLVSPIHTYDNPGLDAMLQFLPSDLIQTTTQLA